MIDVEALRVQPDLTGEKVVLTQLDESHLDDSWASLQDMDPESRRLTGTHTTFTHEQIRKWNASRPGLTDRADWAILRAGDRVYVGDAALTDVDAGNASAGFRIALSRPGDFGRGYGTEAVRLVLDYAFGLVGLHRVQLEVFDFNPRARRVYEKCGFVAEGVQREALRWDGAWHDVIRMGVLESDRRG
ncbi:GNAT family N-acetyltransferase [Amycolatopsis sp. NPDC059027]|uniref:GNAT family N-acetyltransferase n=1 Tax=unclassified Amycolatopsis TaxID=2618356 RepID=UPI00366BF865